MIEIRTQCIQPEVVDPKKTIIVTHEFSKPSSDVLDRKGQLFGVFELEVSIEFDLNSAIKLLVDTVEKDYYKNIDQTPIKSIEQSLKNALLTIGQFRSMDDSTSFSEIEADSKMNISLAVIWNQILYVANIGKNASYLVRGSGARDLYEEKMYFPEITSNSILLEDEDVLILGSQNFAEMFSSKEIFDNLVGMASRLTNSESKNKSGVMLIKINNKSVAIKSKKNNKIINKNKVGNFFVDIKKKINAKSKLSDEFKPFQDKKSAPILSITDRPKPITMNSVSTKPRRILNSSKNGKLKSFIGIIIILSLIGAGYGIYSISSNSNESTKSDNKNDISIQSSENKENIDSSLAKSAPNGKVLSNALEKKQDERPEKFVKFQKSIIYHSTEKKQLILIDTDKNTEKIIVDKVGSVDQFKCYEKLCILNSENVLWVFSPSTSQKIDKYPIEGNKQIYDISYYANNIYILTPEDVLTFSITEKNPTPNSWIKKGTTLKSPKYLEANGEIYVVEAEEISKYYSGAKQEKFSYKISEANSMNSVWISAKNVYSYDKSNNSIIVIDRSSGNLSKTINFSEKGFADPDSIQAVFMGYLPTTAVVLYNNVFYEITL